MGATVGDWLAARFAGASRQSLKRMIQHRRILLNGAPARALTQAVGESDQLRVLDRPRPQLPSPAPLAVVHEDEDLLVVHKPAGLLTSTVAREKRPTALAIIRAYVAARSPRAVVGLIHRLDRDASGVLVFSKNRQAYAALKEQFFVHSVGRVYSALVGGEIRPPRGAIESRLLERADGTVRSTTRPGCGQRAVTHYRVVENRSDGTTLLEVRLETGRKHQIRAQLAERGRPIVGDRLYGGAPAERLMLAAVMLELDHPRGGGRVRFEFPAPWSQRAAAPGSSA